MLVLVSVIMPSYNHAKYLPQAIESVLNQSVRDLELIIVDDCSTDNSKTIIETYMSKDARVRAAFHKKNLGIAKTVNDCIAEAKGQYVAFTASDDVWVESKLEKQLAILENDDSLVVWSEGEIINAKGASTGVKFTERTKSTRRKKSGQIFQELLNGNFIFGTSLIYKREYTQTIHYDERLKYLNDFKVMIGLAKEHRFYFIDEPLAKYRIHGKNSVGADKKGWIQDNAIISEYFLQEFGDKMSGRTKAERLLYIAKHYSLQNMKKMAYYYYLQALKVNPSRTTVRRILIIETVEYLTLILDKIKVIVC